jgi:hypothetical protein
MNKRDFLLLLLLVLLTPSICRAQAADISGTWILNSEKSSWGSATRPFKVILFIEHREPALKYSGTIRYADDETRDFSFDGAIDGKPYLLERPAGKGTMSHQRLGPREIKTEFRTDDGSHVQTVNTTISRDGKTLTRGLEIRTASQVRRWKEVYDRK